MNQSLRRPDQFFFGTRELPCPYLPDRLERKVVTELSGQEPQALYGRLSRAGFRRSHGLAYRPACTGCGACIPVRINAADFTWTRSFRRILRMNRDLTETVQPAMATVEQYRLFQRYQNSRHGGGDMSGMALTEYRDMIEETPVDTDVIEYRDTEGTLVGVMLADRTEDGFSAVYSFFAPEMERRSLGSHVILSQVLRASDAGLPFVYLGYWIADSRKMAYKTRFRPLEALGDGGWTPLTE